MVTTYKKSLSKTRITDKQEDKYKNICTHDGHQHLVHCYHNAKLYKNFYLCTCRVQSFTHDSAHMFRPTNVCCFSSRSCQLIYILHEAAQFLDAQIKYSQEHKSNLYFKKNCHHTERTAPFVHENLQ